jgi:hypothetical protein
MEAGDHRLGSGPRFGDPTDGLAIAMARYPTLPRSPRCTSGAGPVHERCCVQLCCRENRVQVIHDFGESFLPFGFAREVRGVTQSGIVHPPSRRASW